MCKNHLFRRTSPVRDSHGQWSICNDRSLYPVSTSPAKTPKQRQRRPHINQSLRSRNLDQDVPVCHFRKSKKANDCSKVNLLRKPIFLSSSTCASQTPSGGEPQRPLPAMCAPFTQEWWHHHMTPVQEHPSLNEPIAALSSGDVILCTPEGRCQPHTDNPGSAPSLAPRACPRSQTPGQQASDPPSRRCHTAATAASRQLPRAPLGAT